MKINSSHLSNIKYKAISPSHKDMGELKDRLDLSSAGSDIKDITYTGLKIEEPREKASFLIDHYTSNPLAVAGKTMGGTVGILSQLELTPKEEFKKFLELAKDNPQAYKQKDFNLTDREGDAYLIRKLDEVPGKLLKALIKDNYREKDIKEEETLRDDFTVGRNNPIKIDALVNKFMEIIQKHADVKPFIGEVHKWSPEARKYHVFGWFDRLKDFITGKQKDFPSPIFTSKIFMMLACGWTERFAITGKEKELEEKLMSYPDNSLQLHNVMEESYLLHKGDLYQTLLCIENILAKDPYREDREKDPLQDKLSYIRNDSKPLGDKYGSWYHFFGAALYGLLRPGFLSKGVVLTEAAGSFFLEGPDKQETLVNCAGADFGNKLKKMVKKEVWKDPLSSTADKDYMDLTEFNES